MQQLSRFLAGLGLVLFILALGASQTEARAASKVNLLKGLNPSFEQGLLHWSWSASNDGSLNIVSDSANANCGVKALEHTGGISQVQLFSPTVPMTAKTKYRITIWMKISGAGVSADLWGYDQVSVTKYKFTELASGITDTAGQWEKVSGTFTSMAKPGNGQLYVNMSEANVGSSLILDCASIQPL